MEIDSPFAPPLTPRQLIVKRLIEHGVPEEVLSSSQSGLVAFIKDYKLCKSDLVSVILPSDGDLVDDAHPASMGSDQPSLGLRIKDRFRESMVWLQWIMFEGDPGLAMTTLANMSTGQRGVCGAIWGHNDIAYRCLTCELDPTCAICVPCFMNGNHENHDYSTINTGGGCCDCGDVTAWKREGFCSNHKGADEIQPLADEHAYTIGPVFDALLVYWKHKLLHVEATHPKATSGSDCKMVPREIVSELTCAIVEMLLEFCRYSESLLSFVSKKVCSFEGLLDILVRAERQLRKESVKKLHELLLKLLGEPVFKYEFAKAFVKYYPTVIDEGIKQSSDSVYKKYPLIATFSVQILTVPTLTPRLVKEMNLLDMFVGCLEDIFVSCAGEDARIQLVKWNNMYETTLRLIDDIRFVLSHDDVLKHIINERRSILSIWVRLLGFMQGMDPQKRETGIHVENESEHMHLPFILDYYVALVHTLLVDGAYTEEMGEDKARRGCELELNDGESLRHAKVGRVSHESSVCNAAGRSIIASQLAIASQAGKDAMGQLSVPSSFVWLASECIMAVENWLEIDIPSEDLLNVFSPTSEYASGSNFIAFKRTLSKFRKGNNIFRRFSCLNDPLTRSSPSLLSNLSTSSGMESLLNEKLISESSSQNECSSESSTKNVMEVEVAADSRTLGVLRLSEWPYLGYDVSSQSISLHIPLHRLLSSILHKGLRQLYGEPVMAKTTDSISNDTQLGIATFFSMFLGSCHPCGFSAFIMEQPLRIRVFCAQVHAGMWKRNGDAALVSCELYRTTRWSEQSMELDLFLLQCCAALAPADHFVDRIVERFGLTSYLSFYLGRLTENEPVLVQEMLALLIQIVTERRFCGMTTAECLKRELIQRLSVGDATHSQLVKSLPRDLCKNSRIQEILDDIASYSDPSGLKQGMYSLRPSFWKEIDLYHPRWSPKDLQVAEERYLRICSVSALTTQSPRWTKIYHPLNEVAKVAISKAVLQIVRAVLYYAVFTVFTESRAPDAVLLSALHLLALALDICKQYKMSGKPTGSIPLLASACELIACEASKTFGEQNLLSLLVLLMRTRKKNDSAFVMEAGNYDISSFIGTLLKIFCELETECMTFLRKLAPEFVDHLFNRENKDTIMGIPAGNIDRKMKAKERQAAIMAKMKADQSKFLASVNVSESDELPDPSSGKISDDASKNIVAQESTNDICSLCHDQTSKTPVSFLIHLQKSRLVSFANSGHPSWAAHHSEGGQTSASNCRQFERTYRSTLGSDIVSESLQSPQNYFGGVSRDGQIRDEGYLESLSVQFSNKGPLPLPCPANDVLGTSQTLEKWEESMYALVWEQVHNQLQNTKSTDATKYLHFDENQMTECTEASLKHIVGPSDEGTDYSSGAKRDRLSMYGDFGPLGCDGVFLSSCGHAVHQGCLDRYLSSLRERRSRRVAFEGEHIVDLDQGEFLCPVCRLLANCVFPALPADSPSVTSFSYAKHTDSAAVEHFLIGVHKALYVMQTTSNVVDQHRVLETLLGKKSVRENTYIRPLLQALYSMYIPDKKNNFSEQVGASQSSVMWDTLKYSLMSVEIAARTGKTSVTPCHSLDSLYSELKSSGEIVFSLLAKIVDEQRSKDPGQTFLRLRGIQLLAESISMDHPVDAFSPSGQRYKRSGAGKHSELDLPYYDIRFWERTSDPILAHDPFSSLMWTLFCLPKPFLFCRETFASLVHLFYIVCVTQTMAAYYGKFEGNASEPSLQDSMIGDVTKFIGNSRVSRQYFASSYVDDISSVHDDIRRMSFPFLRRCTLLSKSLSTLASGNPQDTSFYYERAQLTNKDSELTEIQVMEHMHQIPSLDDILKDRNLRSLVLIWLNRFEAQFMDCDSRHYLTLTPAVPFKLINLPHIYRDLLQSCIKPRCFICKSTIEDPALCLLCGSLCSPLWKSCCSENRCDKHTGKCGAGTGVYLLIRKTTILLQRCARQALWPSPYLDAFGEEDVDLCRGKPLYLNEERYSALCYMVASHGLDRTSKVLRLASMGNFLII